MSTKIYNGFQIHGLATLREIQEWAHKLREECTSKAIENISDTILKKSCYMYDSLTLESFFGGLDISLPADAIEMRNDDNFLYYAIGNLFNDIREQSKSPYQNPTLDYDFELSILPIENKTLAIGFYEQSFYKNILMSEDNGVSEYGYWNNTDKPDGVSEREWKQREKDWNSALPNHSVPSENGLQVSIVHSDKLFILFDKDKHLKEESLPTLEDRANAVTNHIHREVSIKNFCKKEGVELQDMTSSQFINVYYKAEKNKEGKEKIYKSVLSNIDDNMTIDKLKKEKAAFRYADNNTLNF